MSRIDTKTSQFECLIGPSGRRIPRLLIVQPVVPLELRKTMIQCVCENPTLKTISQTFLVKGTSHIGFAALETQHLPIVESGQHCSSPQYTNTTELTCIVQEDHHPGVDLTLNPWGRRNVRQKIGSVDLICGIQMEDFAVLKPHHGRAGSASVYMQTAGILPSPGVSVVAHIVLLGTTLW